MEPPRGLSRGMAEVWVSLLRPGLLLFGGRPALRHRSGKTIAALALFFSIASGSCATAASLLFGPNAAPPPRENSFRRLRFFASSPPNLAGNYAGHAPAADAARRVFRLVLSAGGDADLTTTYLGRDTVVEHGHWTQKGDNLLLTFDPIGSNPPPAPISFTYRQHALHPLHWNRSEWGSAGPPVLTRERHSEP